MLKTRALGAAAVATLALGLQAAPANATTVATQYLACNVTIDNPHYSSGAPGVIAKVRYSCTGNTGGYLTVDAFIERHRQGEMGPYMADAQNLDVTRAVGPGSTGTVYVPAASQPGLPCYEAQWYHAWGSATLRAAGQVKSGSVSSGTVHPNCP